MQTKWEKPYLYEPSNGDLRKDWFVIFYYMHPSTGKMERFRINKGFNQFKTKQDRRSYGQSMIEAIEGLFKEGWSPFDLYNRNSVTANTVVNSIDFYLENKNLKANTLRKYRSELLLYKKWLIENGFENLAMSDAKKVHVTDFLTKYRSERNWSGKNYNHYLNDITAFYNYFYNNFDNIIDKVPSKSLTRESTKKKGNLAYNDWQFAKLKELMLNNGDRLLYTFCSFVYYGALRNEAECNYLKAGDFNFRQKTLRIDAEVAKNKETEYVPLYPDFLELLYDLKIDQLPSDYYVFGKTKNQRYVKPEEFVIGAPYPVGQDYFARKFRHYKKELNLSERHGIYCYKHTRAVHLGEDGEDLFKIMKLFRHKDLATTMIYMEGLGINTRKVEYNKGRRF